MTATERQAVFPPDVLARIAPDVSLQRHLALGLRPSLRGIDEFRPMLNSPGNLNNLGSNSVVGLSTVKCGDTHLFCGVTIGINEMNMPDELLTTDNQKQYTSVYPVVEIARGRLGAPSDEEMMISQKLYNYVLHLRLLPLQSLEITPGYQITDEALGNVSIVYPDDASLALEDLLSLNTTVNVTKKRFKYVLYAHLKVFSRSGPLFDVAHYALMSALKNVKLPRVYMADSGIDPNVRVPVRSRGNFGHLDQSANLFCIDANNLIATPLTLNSAEAGVSSSFGLIDLDSSETVLLADLEGEAEEYCAESKISIVASGDKLKHVSIAGGGANVTLDTFRKAASISKARAELMKA